MTCTECKSKLKVIESRKDDTLKEVYRKRLCLNCNRVVYSVETLVDYENDELYQNKWRLTNRGGERYWKKKLLDLGSVYDAGEN